MLLAQPKRKKWTEAEERTLIDKYGEMVFDGTLNKMKTREKKFKPIALHVNSMHHVLDLVLYPWQWTWKDVSTKVQNMRHQYALVKQKIRRVDSVGGDGDHEFDWMKGLSYWSNFLRYKEVFGDVAVAFGGAGVGDGNGDNGGFDGGGGHGIETMGSGHLRQNEVGGLVSGIDGVEKGVIGLEFEYQGEEGEDNYDDSSRDRNHCKDREDKGERFVCEEIAPTDLDMRKKRKVARGCETKGWGFLANQIRQMKEMELRFEQIEAEREQERQRREHVQMEVEQKWERKWEEGEKEKNDRAMAREKLRLQRRQEWEEMEKEADKRELIRTEERLMYEKEWEERLNLRRSEWKKKMDDMLTQHRVEMNQMQTRILHEQQNLTGQLLGIVSQWTGHPTGLSDHTGASSHYFSQMMQNLQNVNGMVHADSRVDEDNQEDQFIMDG
ncbi:hypothetical protein LIER_28048 [Lithospermum erythrorhizon]|uniref:Uncharacterized protein n=1 Tax=Lithospermum erythrorhizon TaxID=34254 RepID=A0AAV3REJ3_LITER